MTLLRKIKIIGGLTARLVLVYVKSLFSKKSNKVIFVPEFGAEGGAFTYFKYMLDYYELKKISYYLVLSKSQLHNIDKKDYRKECAGVIESPEIWRPYFKKTNSLSYNLELFIHQLQELLFFSKLNLKFKPSSFYFSVTNPEHFLFEFCLPTKLFYICHTLTNDCIDSLNHKILNFCLEKRKKIIVMSHSARKLIVQNWRINEKKAKFISVVYNYYDEIPQFSFQKVEDSKFTILTIGSLEWYKNPFLWCEIAKKMTEFYGADNIKFIWLGSGSLKKECEQLVSSLPNVSFLGFQSNVENFYMNTDVYLQPSVSESFGISVVGAMAHKLPCIVSNAGGLVEVVDDGKTGFIVNDQLSEKYLDKLSYLLENPYDRLQIGNRGYNKFKTHFTKELWYKNMEEIMD